MPIKFKIEKQFLYLVMKALRAKNDQVLHAIIKKLNDFLPFFILLSWKLNQPNSFFCFLLDPNQQLRIEKIIKKKTCLLQKPFKKLEWRQ